MLVASHVSGSMKPVFCSGKSDHLRHSPAAVSSAIMHNLCLGLAGRTSQAAPRDSRSSMRHFNLRGIPLEQIALHGILMYGCCCYRPEKRHGHLERERERTLPRTRQMKTGALEIVQSSFQLGQGKVPLLSGVTCLQPITIAMRRRSPAPLASRLC